MAATTQDRATRFRDGLVLNLPVASATKIPAGVIVCNSAAGYAVNGGPTNTYRTMGVARAMADNSAGSNGGISIEVRRGVFCFANSAADDAIAAADIGNACYVADNQTVAKTDNSGARPAAGKILGVEAIGVWVEFR
jgi:hypothetical protein